MRKCIPNKFYCILQIVSSSQNTDSQEAPEDKEEHNEFYMHVSTTQHSKLNRCDVKAARRKCKSEKKYAVVSRKTHEFVKCG